jgi:hypothetical protein
MELVSSLSLEYCFFEVALTTFSTATRNIAFRHHGFPRRPPRTRLFLEHRHLYLRKPWDSVAVVAGVSSRVSPYSRQVLSIGLSCVYAGSRVLTALAETGYAPKVFTYIDKSGRPLYSGKLAPPCAFPFILVPDRSHRCSVIAVLLFGPIAYVNVVSAGDTVFK